MARHRKNGVDLSYAELHRKRLPELYQRHGHRLDLLDLDWLENCHWCRRVLAIYEEMRDVGQNLDDKNTGIMRGLARRAGVPLCVFAWRTDRPGDVQERIDELNRELRSLEAAFPIVGIRARQLYPRRSGWVDMTPDQWLYEGVLILHRAHHAYCVTAQANGEGVRYVDRLADARNQSRIWTPEDQLVMETL